MHSTGWVALPLGSTADKAFYCSVGLTESEAIPNFSHCVTERVLYALGASVLEDIVCR